MEDTENKKSIENIELVLPLETYRKIMAYAEICKTEISGFADLEYDAKTNKFIAGEVYLLEQEAGGADVNMDEETMSKWNLQMIKKSKKQLPRLWWHSHVNMSVFLSGIDEATLTDLQNDSFIVALVVNKHFQTKAKAYIYTETTIASTTKMFGKTEKEKTEEKVNIAVEDLPVHIQLEYEKIPQALIKEVKDKVKSHTPKWPLWNGKKKKKSKIYMPDEVDDAQGNFLPKDKDVAKARLDAREVTKHWSTVYKTWMYQDTDTQEVFIDFWNTLGDNYPAPYKTTSWIPEHERGQFDD